MAIRFITGKPGDGKSMVSTQTLCRQVVQTKRQIVTNLPIIPGPLWAFLRVRYGHEIEPDRITILNEDEVKQFFLHRGRGWVAPQPKERKEGGDGRIDYANVRRTVTVEAGVLREETLAVKDLPSVLYIIDEAHLHFGSRQWADTAQSALFYLSQHRHLGDEVFFVTQHVKQVDSALRRLAQEFWRVTNYGNRYPFGVKLPDYFVVDVFNTEPGLLAPIIDTRKLKLDVEGLGSCYDTAGGVGMVGGLADTVDKRRGVPWQAVLGVGVVVLACLLMLPGMAGKLFASKMNAAIPTNAAPLVVKAPRSPALPPAAPAPASAPAPAPVMLRPMPVPAHASTASVRPVQFSPVVEPPRIKWLVRKGDSVSLGLHNGDTYTVGDGRLSVLGQFAVLDGNKVFRLPQ